MQSLGGGESKAERKAYLTYTFIDTPHTIHAQQLSPKACRGWLVVVVLGGGGVGGGDGDVCVCVCV